jgi:hypothetical protein
MTKGVIERSQDAVVAVDFVWSGIVIYYYGFLYFEWKLIINVNGLFSSKSRKCLRKNDEVFNGGAEDWKKAI